MHVKKLFKKAPVLITTVLAFAVCAFYIVFTSPSLLPRGTIKDAVGALSVHGETQQSSEETLRVNINTATAAELMQLRGIGEARAQAIIDYRTSGMRFNTIEDIMKVEGIGEGIFSEIALYICTE